MTATQSQIRDALDRLHAYADYDGCLQDFRTVKSALDTQKPAGDAVLIALDVLAIAAEDSLDPDNVAAHKKTIRRALNGNCGGGDRPDCEEIAHAAACLLLPNNGVSDTVWYRNGMTLYEFLASYSGKELTGVVEDDYEILTGEKYPAQALTADNAKRGDNTAADTKMGDLEFNELMEKFPKLGTNIEWLANNIGNVSMVDWANFLSVLQDTLNKALSHDNAELGKVGEIFDKLTQYAEDSIGYQYETLSAALVEKLAKEGLAIIDRLMGVKG